MSLEISLKNSGDVIFWFEVTSEISPEDVDSMEDFHKTVSKMDCLVTEELEESLSVSQEFERGIISDKFALSEENTLKIANKSFLASDESELFIKIPFSIFKEHIDKLEQELKSNQRKRSSGHLEKSRKIRKCKYIK